MTGLSSDTAAQKEMLDDPRVAEHFKFELPALKAALDLSRIAADAKVSGKWAARKMPVIAGCELGGNQSYNALDRPLRCKRIGEAHQVLASAQSLQQHIDQTRYQVIDCP